MPPSFNRKNPGSTTQKKTKTAAKAPTKISKTPPKSSVSSTPSKSEPEAQGKPSPIVETLNVREKAVESFKDLNESQTQKENPLVDANEEDKESTKDADKPSAEGSEEGGKGIDSENIKEIDTVMQEAHDNEYKEHHDELARNNAVIGDQTQVNEEEGVEEHDMEIPTTVKEQEEGVEEEQDMEIPTTVKEQERIKQKEFEVFVGGLDKDADEEDLKKVFSEIGEVVEIRLPKNSRTQKNKSFAFVRFASVEQAKKAVAELKNPQVRGKQCGVARTQDNETLYVRNICKSWTKEALQQKLTEYGIQNAEEITLMEDPEQQEGIGTNRGFAFLEFPTHLEATNALIRLQKPDVFFGTDVCAKVAFAKSAIEPDEEVMAKVKSVFVDGLPPSWDEERVLEKFKAYGEIEEVELARNMPAAKRKDFGFISFRTREAALACIEGVNKNEVNEEEEDKKVTLKATLRKPQQKGRSVKVGVRTARYGSVPWVHRGRGFLDERRQHFGRAYDRRPSGSASASAYIRSARRNYREDGHYLSRRSLPSARSHVTASRPSSYQGDYGYSESMLPRRAPYPENSNSTYRMNGMSSDLYHYGDVDDYAGVSCGSKRPYSVVNNDLPTRHSRSRLDYEVGAPDSRYERVSRVGQDSQLGYGAGNRTTVAIYSSDYLPRGNGVRGGPHPSAGYGQGNSSASYY